MNECPFFRKYRVVRPKMLVRILVSLDRGKPMADAEENLQIALSLSQVSIDLIYILYLIYIISFYLLYLVSYLFIMSFILFILYLYHI